MRTHHHPAIFLGESDCILREGSEFVYTAPMVNFTDAGLAAISAALGCAITRQTPIPILIALVSVDCTWLDDFRIVLVRPRPTTLPRTSVLVH